MRSVVFLFLLAGCSSGPAEPSVAGSSGSSGNPAAGGSTGSSAGGASGVGGSELGGAAGSSAGNAGAPASAGATSAGLQTLGSLVVLGDSLSDGGGQAPFYYDLLRTDLTAKYGPIEYRNAAQSGSKTGALGSQIQGLPTGLPGPVAVAITSGGNDMKASLVQIVAGLDAPLRAQMGANISAALDLLLAPGRFGAGVEVHVFETNIYDASDGEGNYAENDCAFASGYPALPTDGYFAAWNGEISNQLAAKSQALVDLHGLFRLHGFNHPPNWYASDCTHPVSIGHDQLRRLFYSLITGESLP